MRSSVLQWGRSFLWRLGLLGGLWWLLTGGEGELFGMAAVTLAVFASLLLKAPRPHRLHLLGSIRFACFFLWESWRAGIDVAQRTLRPRLPLQPGLVSYKTCLPQGLPRVVLANTLSLLPGTLVVQLEGSHLLLHVLDQRADILAGVRDVEARITAMFGLSKGAAEWT